MIAAAAWLFIVIVTSLFASYNSRGLSSWRKEYIRHLTESNDFELVQEHWQLNDRLSTFQNELRGTLTHAISATDDTHLMAGRGHGGCAIGNLH